MGFYGAPSASDRAFSALAYLIPFSIGVKLFSQYLFNDFPVLQVLAIPAFPLILIYQSIPMGEFVVFLLLLFFVIRNTNISYFIRFNVMQAILLDIALILSDLVLGLVARPLGNSFIMETFYNMVFLATLASVGYGIFKSTQGTLADEIPAISEAARIQVRY
jgi:hypothetical protein